MTNPEDKGGKPNLTPQGNAPSWVDEVLGSSKAAPTSPAPTPPAPTVSHLTGPNLSGPEDLKIPASRPAPAAPASSADDWISRATGGNVKDPQMPQGPAVQPRHIPSSSEVLSDFVRPLAEKANAHAAPPPPTQTAMRTDAWGDPVTRQPLANAPRPAAYASGDVSQKKLIAGLLAIFLGSLGVHKFYLGMNNPGAILLGVNVGVWILAMVLGFLTLGIGLFATIPAASFVSSALGIFGLIEGIIYLTKTDADFEREYLVGKKPWL